MKSRKANILFLLLAFLLLSAALSSCALLPPAPSQTVPPVTTAPVTTVPHDHVFTERVPEERYLLSPATCLEQALYLYACPCGKAGSAVYAYGDLLPHDYDDSAVCLVCCHTENPTPGIEYLLNDDGLSYSVIDFSAALSTDIRIPDEYNGLPVTEISSYAGAGSRDITSVTIPSSVKRIGEGAFTECSALTSVRIGEGVESIGERAFRACTVLPSITIPGSVREIERLAFDACSQLESVTLKEGIPALSEYAFSWCTALQSIELPAGMTALGSHAFAHCSVLRSVTIPESILEIGENAFTYCPLEEATLATHHVSSLPKSQLKTVIITAGESIDDNLFSDCAALQSVTLPLGLTRIGDFAFYHCVKLEGIVIPEGVTSIGEEAFSMSLLKTVVIPESVKEIGEKAFFACTPQEAYLATYHLPDLPTAALKTVVITAGESIGSRAFYNCQNLSSVTISESVRRIGEEAFFNCMELKSIVIPGNVTEIADHAFSTCTALSGITLGEGVETIGAYAFHYCRALEALTVPESVTSIGLRAFDGCHVLEALTFLDPAGWHYTSEPNASGTPINLADPAANAAHFKNPYEFDPPPLIASTTRNDPSKKAHPRVCFFQAARGRAS